MWVSGDWLVPHLNGQPYSHKPPLLFWLINLAWSLGGPSALAARLVILVFSMGSAAMTGLIARQLWPHVRGIGPWSVMVFAASGPLVFFNTLVMFDGLLTFTVLLAVYGMLLVWRRGSTAWWALSAAGLGLGILAKGPVALLHFLAAGAFASLAFNREAPGGRRGWYLGLAAAVLGGAVLALAWAVPAAVLGGPEYREMILWSQTAERMVRSFSHARPFWYYLPLLPLFLLPWCLWPPLWTWVRRQRWKQTEVGFRFCVVWFVALFVAFSAISGKQIHYLLPSLPAVALVVSRMILEPGSRVRRRDLIVASAPLLAIALVVPLLAGAQLIALPEGLPPPLSHLLAAPINPLAWGAVAVLPLLLYVPLRAPDQAAAIAAGVAVTLVTGHLLATPALAAYDWSRLKATIAEREACGLAWFGDYAGEFGYIAGVTRPVERVNIRNLPTWLAAHPGGLAIDKGYDAEDAVGLPRPDILLDYRTKRLAVWLAAGPTAACESASRSD